MPYIINNGGDGSGGTSDVTKAYVDAKDALKANITYVDTQDSALTTAINNHINATDNPHDTIAAQVNITDAGNKITASNVEDALQELSTLIDDIVSGGGGGDVTKAYVDAQDSTIIGSIDDHINATDNPHNTTASQININDVGNRITATTVEGAIDELISMIDDVEGVGTPVDISMKADITYVDSKDALKAPLLSPNFTGSPTAPTLPPGTNTTGLATAAFVTSAVNTAVTSVFTFRGTWDASTNTPTLTNGVGEVGDVYKVAVAGNFNGVDYSVNDDVLYDGAVWSKIGNIVNNASTTVKGIVQLDTTISTSPTLVPTSNLINNALAEIYTKDEVDDLISQGGGSVDISGKADKTYVDSQLSTKADKSYVDTQDATLTTAINNHTGLTSSNPHGTLAQQIAIADAGGKLTATNIEDALNEIITMVEGAGGASTASEVSVVDTNSVFTSGDVEGALAELASRPNPQLVKTFTDETAFNAYTPLANEVVFLYE